jgi:hypothetical protein
VAADTAEDAAITSKEASEKVAEGESLLDKYTSLSFKMLCSLFGFSPEIILFISHNADVFLLLTFFYFPS